MFHFFSNNLIIFTYVKSYNVLAWENIQQQNNLRFSLTHVLRTRAQMMFKKNTSKTPPRHLFTGLVKLQIKQNVKSLQFVPLRGYPRKMINT